MKNRNLGNWQSLIGREFVDIQAEGLNIWNWSSGQDHNETPPSQVHIVFGVPGVKYQFAIRLKTKDGAQKLIDALIQHRDEVWEHTPDVIEYETKYVGYDAESKTRIEIVPTPEGKWEFAIYDKATNAVFAVSKTAFETAYEAKQYVKRILKGES